jgi:hypothetical protein
VHHEVRVHLEPRNVCSGQRGSWRFRFIPENAVSSGFGLVEVEDALPLENVIFDVHYLREVVNDGLVSGDYKVVTHARIVVVNCKMFDHVAAAVHPTELSLWLLEVVSEDLQLISNHFGMSSERLLPLTREVFLA